MTTVQKPSLLPPSLLPPVLSPSLTKRITLEEFVAMGEGPPYYEFEDGQLIPRNGGTDPRVSPKSRHQKMLLRLAAPMDHYVNENNLGEVFIEVDVYMSDGKLYIPDITFVAVSGNAHLAPADDKIHGAPELVVEILSENAQRDQVYKRRAYQQNGVRWYWIIDTGLLTLEEFQFLPDGSTLTNLVIAGEDFLPACFPGLTLNLAALMGEQTASPADNANNLPTTAQENPS
jgi:Uma2 family endonuclease